MHHDIYFESLFWDDSMLSAGLDEVGRGSLAGPVMAGCVIYDINSDILKKSHRDGVLIRDSKQLTKKQRAEAYRWITENCLSYSIGSSSVAEINRKGIVKATHSAFRRAVGLTEGNLVSRVNCILIDGYNIPYIRNYNTYIKTKANITINGYNAKYDEFRKAKQIAIVGGDRRVFSISSASIIAKVTRDRYMEGISFTKRNSVYKWHQNKGYGTKGHIKAISIYGLTRHHRRTFAEKFCFNQ